jgi:hypothetical protein
MPNETLERTDFAGVIEKEIRDIEQRRRFRQQGAPDASAVAEVADTKSTKSSEAGSEERSSDIPWETQCHRKNFFGICISGGGIRSATHALGVLQGLMKKGLLQQADYLSTVSGGGYIGSWLQGILRRPAAGDPYDPLDRPVPKSASEDPITFLRKYSNYLAPRRGLSIDTLLIPMIWSRNMILNQVIIIAAFLAAFLPAFLPGAGFLWLISLVRERCGSAFWLMICASFIAAVPVWFMARNLSRIAVRSVPDREQEDQQTNRNAAGSRGTRLLAVLSERSQVIKDSATNSWRTPRFFDYGPGQGTKYVGLWVILPVFVAILFMMCALYGGDERPGSFIELFDRSTEIWRGGALFGLFCLLQASGGFRRCFIRQREEIGKRGGAGIAFLHILWMSAICAVFTWFLLKLVTWLFWQPCDKALGSQLTIAYAPPLYVLALMSGMVLQIGLMGKDFPDASREWLARAGTLFWIASAVWGGYFSLTVFAPFAIAKAYVTHYVGNRSVISVITAWLTATAGSVFAGKSPKTKGANNTGTEVESAFKSGNVLDLIARYGPFVAIGGFLLTLACAAQWLWHAFQLKGCECSFSVLIPSSMAAKYWISFDADSSAHWYGLLALMAGSVAIFFVLSLRVNINEFSMHHFYKNRLVRCYLGASAISGVGKGERRPDWFTGFDPKDDIALKNLRFDERPSGAPYPIVNATVNVTVGTELATQERKGLPWFFSPWYSGFYPSRSDKDRSMRGEVDKDKTYALTDQLGQGVALGTAMAISGAAANPNWGSHSSAQTAFLLTLFNVRLGWWMGNPADENKFKNPGPGIALWSLFNELSGKLDEGSAYLNLSDGGHFENLGMYELIRRRCRYVIAIDGEADPDYRFEGLGGAVRKCRADFGVDIVINPRPIQLKNGASQAHCVVGRIYYPEPEYGGRKSGPGWLLYIKSSVTGDEPADVEEYRREHPDFPQQSTLEQFFTESQFESYRMLGLHAACSTFDSYTRVPRDLDELFEHLSARWEMPPQAPEGAFTRHAEAYAALMARLSDHGELKNMDRKVVQDFPEKIGREEFYFWLDLIQLAENVFVDLNLADKHLWEHPTYAGWNRLFKYWARNNTLRLIWGSKNHPYEGQRKIFGKAFQNFFDNLIERAEGDTEA